MAALISKSPGFTQLRDGPPSRGGSVICRSLARAQHKDVKAGNACNNNNAYTFIIVKHIHLYIHSSMDYADS